MNHSTDAAHGRSRGGAARRPRGCRRRAGAPRCRISGRRNALLAGAVAVLFGAGILLAGCSAAGEEGEAGGEASSGAPARTSGGAGGGGGQGGGSGGPGGNSAAAGPEAAPSWPTAAAEVDTRSRSVEVGGRLRPRTRITHAAPVAGIVRNIAVEPGDRVEPGTVLFVIERDEVGQTFRPTEVEARIGGVVSEMMIQAEEQVRAGDAGAVVVGRDGYVLEARVSDKDIAGVTVGQAVTARSSAGATVSGRLSVRGEEPDYETGLFPVTFRFPGAPGIGIGTFLLVELPIREVEGIFVSRDAVDRRYGRDFLWVVDEAGEGEGDGDEAEGALARREVSLGDAFDDEVLVADGLAPGERYVVRLSGREREGAPVPAAGDDDGGGN
ncbi:MAG: HlyD family efflux transporter periplasmic adaptor subunit [Spirochaetia bacterium]